MVRGWGAKHSLSSPTLWTFRNFGRSITNPMESEVHSTAPCKKKRIETCRTSSRHERTKWQPILFARNSCGNRCFKDSPCSGGKNAAGPPSLQKSIKAHNSCYVPTVPCAASKKQKAERLANAEQPRGKLPKSLKMCRRLV